MGGKSQGQPAQFGGQQAGFMTGPGAGNATSIPDYNVADYTPQSGGNLYDSTAFAGNANIGGGAGNPIQAGQYMGNLADPAYAPTEGAPRRPPQMSMGMGPAINNMEGGTGGAKPTWGDLANPNYQRDLESRRSPNTNGGYGDYKNGGYGGYDPTGEFKEKYSSVILQDPSDAMNTGGGAGNPEPPPPPENATQTPGTPPFVDPNGFDSSRDFTRFNNQRPNQNSQQIGALMQALGITNNY